MRISIAILNGLLVALIAIYFKLEIFSFDWWLFIVFGNLILAIITVGIEIIYKKYFD